MAAFRLRYYQWHDNLNLDGALGEGPLFHVYTGATDLAFGVSVFLATADVRALRQEIAVQEETIFPQRLSSPLRCGASPFHASRNGSRTDSSLPSRQAPTFGCVWRKPIFPPSDSCSKRKRVPTRYGKDATCSALWPARTIPRVGSRQGSRLLRPLPAAYAVCVSCPIPIMSVLI